MLRVRLYGGTVFAKALVFTGAGQTPTIILPDDSLRPVHVGNIISVTSEVKS